MTLYRRKAGQPLKWLIALIIFALALGITFTDVYGYVGGDNSTQGSRVNNSDNSNQGTGLGLGNDSPAAVPEPATLILLAGGLGALYVARRHHKK